MDSKTIATHSHRLKVVAPLIKAVSPDVIGRSWGSFIEHLREGWETSEMRPTARSQEAIEDLFDLLAEMGYYPFTRVVDLWHRLPKMDQEILAALIVGTVNRWVSIGLTSTTFLPLFKFLNDVGMPIWNHKEKSAILVGDVDASLSDALANRYTTNQTAKESEWVEVIL